MTNFWMRLTEALTLFILEPMAKILLLLFLVIFNYIFFNVQNSIDNEYLNL